MEITYMYAKYTKDLNPKALSGCEYSTSGTVQILLKKADVTEGLIKLIDDDDKYLRSEKQFKDLTEVQYVSFNGELYDINKRVFPSVIRENFKNINEYIQVYENDTEYLFYYDSSEIKEFFYFVPKEKVARYLI